MVVAFNYKTQTSDVDREKWNSYFPLMKLDDLKARLTRDMPYEPEFGMRFGRNGYPMITVAKPLKYSFEYGMDNQGKAHLSNGDVFGDFQAHGISAIINRNFYQICREEYFSSISVTAVEAGVYAWSRMGFVPNNISWNKNIIPNIEDRINQGIAYCEKTNRKKLSRAFNEASSHLQPEFTREMWRIVDMEPASDKDRLSFGKILTLPPEMLQSLPYKFNKDDELSYTGYLYLKDGKATARAENYFKSKGLRI